MSQAEALRRIQAAEESGATELNISGLELTELPPALSQLTALTTLYLGNNQLTALPPELFQLTALTTLGLGGNQLTAIPPELGQLTELTTLYLGGNQLTAIPPELFQLTALTTLYLGNNQLTALPSGLGQLTALTKLYLRSNQLTAIPPELGQLTALTELFLQNNKLTAIPPELGQLTALTKLSFSDNQLTALPPELGQLTALTELFLQNNKLTALPPELGQLTALTKLFLQNNKLTALPPELGQLITLATLYLKGNQLTALPPELGKLTALTKLSFSDNQLTALPPELGQLITLAALYFKGNKLIALPPELGKLTALTKLSFSDNQLTALPPELGKLTALTALYLKDNQLTALPPELGKLTALTALYLSGNQLATLPPELGKLTALTQLYLGGNQLTALPPELFQLTALTQFDLRNNKLRKLPPEIAKTNLPLVITKEDYISEGINLSGNPLESPSPEIIRQGTEAVRAYFDSLKTQKTRPLNEVKVVLVGDGGSGKTSLMKRMLGQDFDPKESQTHGINITDLEMKKDGEPLRVRLWDFGGQEIMHATHQFFLSARSLYLVVLDGRRDERPEYWLKHARTFGGHSPVFVVLNKIDENKGHDVERSVLERRYPAIRGFFPVSCKEGAGIKSLMNALEQALANLDMVTTAWPESWFKVKQCLDKDEKRPFLTKAEFGETCNKAGVDSPNDQKVLVRFLNDLGVAIHFDELKLEHTFVLNPRWATSGVYRIINASELAKEKGLLSQRAFSRILAKKSEEDPFEFPREVHLYILNLMCKFELCYELNGGRGNKVLVPDLLPVSPPPFEFDQQTAHKFRISYDLLPRTVMPRLIVRRHEEIEGNLRWRHGVIFRNEKLGARALIRADYENRAIFGWVSGGGVHQYLITLLDAIDRINKGFEENKIVEEVACTCELCQGQIEPEFHPMNKVLRFYLSGYRDWPCQRSEVMVPIAQLLGHTLTGETGDFDGLLRKVDENKDDLKAMEPSRLKKTITAMANAAGISGISLKWLIEAIMRLLGG